MLMVNNYYSKILRTGNKTKIKLFSMVTILVLWRTSTPTHLKHITLMLEWSRRHVSLP